MSAPKSTRELLAEHVRIMSKLRTRGVSRTNNNPTSGYAEWLTSQVLGLTLVENSSTGYDATDAEGKRYEIKSR